MKFNYTYFQLRSTIENNRLTGDITEFNLFGFNMQSNPSNKELVSLQFTMIAGVKSKIYIDFKLNDLSVFSADNCDVVFLDFNQPDTFQFIFYDLIKFFSLKDNMEVYLFSGVPTLNFSEFFSDKTLSFVQFDLGRTTVGRINTFFFSGVTFKTINLNCFFSGLRSGIFNDSNVHFLVKGDPFANIFSASLSADELAFFFKIVIARSIIFVHNGVKLIQLYARLCQSLYANETYSGLSCTYRALDKIINLLLSTSTYFEPIDMNDRVSKYYTVFFNKVFTENYRFHYLYSIFAIKDRILAAQPSWDISPIEFSSLSDFGINQKVLNFINENPIAIGEIELSSSSIPPQMRWVANRHHFSNGKNQKVVRLSAQEFYVISTKLLFFDIKFAKFFKPAFKSSNQAKFGKFMIRLGALFSEQQGYTFGYASAVGSFVSSTINPNAKCFSLDDALFTNCVESYWFYAIEKAILLEYFFYFNVRSVEFCLFFDGFALGSLLSCAELSGVGFYSRYVNRVTQRSLSRKMTQFYLFRVAAFNCLQSDFFYLSTRNFESFISFYSDYEDQLAIYDDLCQSLPNFITTKKIPELKHLAICIDISVCNNRSHTISFFKSLHELRLICLVAFRPSTWTTPSATAITDPGKLFIFRLVYSF